MPRSLHAISLNFTKKDRAVFNLLCKVTHPYSPYNSTATAREVNYSYLMILQQRHGWTDEQLAEMLNEELEALK
jgi:hypothetical protein